MEGVIIPKEQFLLFYVLRRIGVTAFIRGGLIGLLYIGGFLSISSALKRIFLLLKGFSYEEFLFLFSKVPLMPRVESTLETLRRLGFKTVLISSGIPRAALSALADRLRADYFFGPEIGISEACLTGEVWGDVIEPRGKALVLAELLREQKLQPDQLIMVADDRNNVSAFEMCAVKIGYNPDFIIARKADHVLGDELSDIIPIVNEETRPTGKGPQRLVLFRELIHIAGFSIPFVCMSLVNRYLMAALIILVMILYVISETLRMFGTRLPIFSDITVMSAGDSELRGLVASPLYYGLGIVMSLILFPEPIGYVSIEVLTLGDGFASVIGKKFGRRTLPFNKNKSVEGTTAGLLFSLIGSALFVDPFEALIASTFGMLAEMLPSPLNDNIGVPMASALALTFSRIL